jgi:hypothetical protein
VSPAALERLAVMWRAITGVVPYRVWIALPDESRRRLASLTQTAAQLELDPPRRSSTAARSAAP